MKDQLFKSHIANHLKAQRRKRGLSLDATAKLTGVSKAMLGQIEREESSPTISTLWKIASGLDTSFSAFFADDPRLHHSDFIFPEDPRMKVETIFPYKTDSGMEMFVIKLIEYHEQMSSPHKTGVIEHIYVLEGELEVNIDGELQHLKQGEKTRFFGDQPHGYKALTETVVFQNIICYPT